MRQVAEALHLEQSTVNRQANAAVRRGLVERIDHTGHGARALQATGDGRDMFETELARIMAIFAAGLDALPEDARDDFVRNLGIFAVAYTDAAERRVQHESDPIHASAPVP